MLQSDYIVEKFGLYSICRVLIIEEDFGDLYYRGFFEMLGPRMLHEHSGLLVSLMSWEPACGIIFLCLPLPLKMDSSSMHEWC